MKLLSLILISLAASVDEGSACCGGGVSTSTLIVGDEKARFGASYSFDRVGHDVGTDGVWRSRQEQESMETLRLEGARVFLDRWQVGAALSVLRRSRSEASSTGLGDSSLTLGWESLPEWEYSLWRPRGVTFLQLVLPTGESIADAEEDFQLDARGRGFWALGIGMVLSKAWNSWDVQMKSDVHRSFSKSFSNRQNAGTLHPGWGGTLGLSGGYNVGLWNLGTSVIWSYEDPVRVRGTVSSSGSAERVTTVAVSAKLALPDSWYCGVVYSDQTLVGSPSNTTLSRGLMLTAQKNISR